MKKLDIPEETAVAITTHMTAWRNDSKAPGLDDDIELTKLLIPSQQVLGWHLFLDGCLHISCSRIYETRIQNHNSKLSPRRWTSALIKKLWEVAWIIWDHWNGILHQHAPDKILLGTQAIQNTIKREMDIGIDPLMTKDEKALFKIKAKDTEEWELDQMYTWYSRVVSARKLCLIRNDLCMRQERNLMRNWL